METTDCDSLRIFISYAPSDDAGETPSRSGADTKSGWVTALVANLKYVLDMRMGRGQAVEFRQDRKGSIPGVSSDEGKGKWSDATAFVIVLSQVYLRSKERRRTLGLIAAEILKRGAARPPVFVVELSDERTKEDFPTELQRIKGYRFWAPDPHGKPARRLRPDPEENEYFMRVNDLGFDLALTLARAESSGGGPPPAPSVEAGPPTVFLAEVAGDLALDDLRDDLQRHLDAEEFAILPAPGTLYPRDLKPFLAAVEGDLGRSSLFVQLLGQTAGAKPPGSPRSYAALQHDCARKMGVPIVQWRSPELRLDTTTDPEYRKMLDGPAIMASDPGEFRREVVRRARELAAPPDADENRTTCQVFVNAEKNDRGLAEDVSRILAEGGATPILPPQGDKPSTILKELEKAYLKSDGLIFTREHSSLDWLKSQLLFWRKVQHKRTSEARAVALLQGPEAPKRDADIAAGSVGSDDSHHGGPDVQVIQCRDGVNEKNLSNFLEALKDPNQS